MTTDTDRAIEPAAPPSGLSIAALILAILVAPVGLILGIVSAVQSKKAGRRAGGMTTAAIIVGAVLTGLSVISAIAVGALGLFAVSTANQAAARAPYCASIAANEADLSYLANTPSFSDVDVDSAIPVVDRLVQAGLDFNATTSAADDEVQTAAADFSSSVNNLRDELARNPVDSLWWGQASVEAQNVLLQYQTLCGG